MNINDNIETFVDWEDIVRTYLRNNNIENDFIFYKDATGKGIVSTSRELSGVRLTITFEKYGAMIIRIPDGEYQKFAKQWKRISPHSKEAQATERKLYELIEMDRRRALGQFYTPSKITLDTSLAYAAGTDRIPAPVVKPHLCTLTSSNTLCSCRSLRSSFGEFSC